ALILASGVIARFYASPDLPSFLVLVAVAGFGEAVAQPVIAVLRRDMTFGTLAGIRTAVALINGVTTIVLAVLGFGPVSFAWGMLAGALLLAVLALAFSPVPVPAILRPSLAVWREVLA